MAPSVGLAHAATALALLALGLNVETRLRAGGLLTAQLSEPEPERQPELTLGRLKDRVGQLEGAVAGLGVRTARCEALLEPPEMSNPSQSARGTQGATNANRPIGKNTTTNTTMIGAQLGGSDCPVGAALAPGDALSWASNSASQGSVGHHDNGCAAKGTCGAPYSYDGLGGGWQLCFA